MVMNEGYIHVYIYIEHLFNIYLIFNTVLVDIVTCMTLDKSGTGEHLVTGSRDTTCVVWKFKNDVIII